MPPGHYRAFSKGNDQITSAFAGLGNANGTWTLRFRDVCANDTGSVSAAALFLTTDGVAPADSNPPDTDITTSPANGIAKTLKVPFGFTSDETGVTYQCALDAAAYALCANPATITVKSGKHTLAVRARDAAGNLDPFPAKTTFTAYDCQSLNADVATLKKQVKAIKKAIKKTENSSTRPSPTATGPRSRSSRPSSPSSRRRRPRRPSSSPRPSRPPPPAR